MYDKKSDEPMVIMPVSQFEFEYSTFSSALSQQEDLVGRVS